MSLADLVKRAAENVQASLRNMWNPLARPVDGFGYRAPLQGYRLARFGKHKDTALTRHEQTRNPAGTKLWKACPEKRPDDPTFAERYALRLFG